jgi:DNA invertase Pin-like site-specific DNA recombinase
MRTALGYVRVSTDEQAGRGLGLEAQRQRIRAYCEMKGLHLATIFEDPGLSGGKPLGSRSAGAASTPGGTCELPTLQHWPS